MILKKAQVGDYIQLANGIKQQVVRIIPALFSHDEWEYELQNGMMLMGYEFTDEDVSPN